MAYHAEFRAMLNPKWSVSEEGFRYKGKLYPWDQVSNPSVFNDPKTGLVNGVFHVTLDNRRRALAYLTKDKAKAQEAFAYMKQKIEEAQLIKSGVDPADVEETMKATDRKRHLVIFREDVLNDIMTVAEQVLPPDEELYVALKGAVKEYLFCTDKMVYIVKRGYATGHTFGGGAFKMPYANITNAEVDFHLTTGYFELSSGGLQNKPLNYWNNKANDPRKAPNAIALVGVNLRDLFEEASRFILEKSNEARNQVVVQMPAPVQPTQSVADQIRELKALVDEGILTQEEFEAKKKQMLGI